MLACWPEPLSPGNNIIDKVILAAEHNKVQFEKCHPSSGEPEAIRSYYPIQLKSAGERHFVVVLEMAARDKEEWGAVARLLRWNAELLSLGGATGNSEPENSVLSQVFQIAVTCLDQGEFLGSATVLVSELAGQFDCIRASFGLLKGRHMEVQVVSHSSRIKKEANLIRAIGAAMDEALDQDSTIIFSPGDTQTETITRAHEELARSAEAGNICTVLVCEGDAPVAAMTLERRADLPWHDVDIDKMEKLSALLGPILALRHRDERVLPVKAWHSLRDWIKSLLGPEHVRLKLTAASAVSLVLFFSLAQGTWRVTAEAVVEGSVQRTIAAPLDGYIDTVEVRPGDTVSDGQLLGTLDDSDLRLQSLKWTTLLQQMTTESREAMARHDRAQVSINNAKIEQARAELELIDEQLARTRLVAPYDGVIIEGDLSQLLGTPVSRGDLLFKVAPLRGYRIILKVDERDIAPVRGGQQGVLILASMPGEKLPFVVEKTTPVSTPGDGQNYFRVEANLTDPPSQLQPGMEGVGKIELGEANLFWLWTRDLFNWLRLQTWTWWR
jgi:RND family efflux transporter MFP subunit